MTSQRSAPGEPTWAEPVALGLRTDLGAALREALDDALHDPATMLPLWTLLSRGEPVVRSGVPLADDVVRLGLASGILHGFEIDGEQWLRSAVCIIAVAQQEQLRWIASDFPWQSGEPAYVGGPGSATDTLLRVVADLSWTGSAADLGCGSGAVAVALAAAGHEVVAVDANRRAVALTELTAALNDLPVSTRLGDYAEPLREAVDLWCANPAFVIGAPHSRTTLRDNPAGGIEQAVSLASAASRSLRPGGVGVLLGNWEYGEGVHGLTEVADRLSRVLPRASVVVHERALVTPERYASVWTDDETERRAWAARLENLGLTAVGTGLIAVCLDGEGIHRVDRTFDQAEIDLAAAVLGSWRDARHS